MNHQASQPVPKRSLVFSQKLYQRMLTAYPRSHREEYGEAMSQLFRDQCRDAWEDGRAWGLAALWLRTLPDLVKTSFIERCSNFNPGKYMSEKLNSWLSPRHPQAYAFFTVFIIVFFLVFSLAAIVTFILPESYASTVRIKVEKDPADSGYTTGVQPDPNQPYDPFFLQTTFEIIQSPVVLSNVVTSLDLNKKWGKKYYGGETLKTTESLALLRQRIDIKPVRNTQLLAITIFSDDKFEAADLANATGKSYQEYREEAQRTRASNNLASLQGQYQQQQAQLDQLQAEKNVLAQKFGITENWAEVRDKYQDQMVDGQRAFKALKTQLDELQGLGTDKLRHVLFTVTGDASLSDLVGKLNLAKQQLAVLTNDYAPSDIHFARVASTIDELNEETDDRVSGIMMALASEVRAKEAALASLQAAMDSAVQNSKPTPANQPYWDKKHELDELLGYHNRIEAKLYDAKLETTVPGDQWVQIVDPAVPGIAPIKPNKPVNLCVGAIAGVFFGGVAGSIAALIAGQVGRRKTAVGAV